MFDNRSLMSGWEANIPFGSAWFLLRSAIRVSTPDNAPGAYPTLLASVTPTLSDSTSSSRSKALLMMFL